MSENEMETLVELIEPNVDERVSAWFFVALIRVFLKVPESKKQADLPISFVLVAH